MSSVFKRYPHCCRREEYPQSFLFGLDLLDLIAVHDYFAFAFFAQNITPKEIHWHDTERSESADGGKTSKKSCSESNKLPTEAFNAKGQ